MSARGPKPKLRVVRSDDKPARRKTVSPKVPAWVPPIARDTWRRVTAELRRQGRLTDENRDAVDAYVSAVATIRRCHKAIEKDGAFFTVPNGAPKPHPGFAILADAEKQMRMMAGRLGIIQESREAGKAAGVAAKHVDGDPFAGDDL